MDSEHKGSCCCCFSLKTGVWLIGALQIANAVSNLYGAIKTGDWAAYGIQLGIHILFGVIFMLHMSHEDRQHSAWRSALFWIYFILVTVAGSVLSYMMTFGFWGNLPNDICSDPDILEKMEMKHSTCTSFFRWSFAAIVTVNLLFNLYCACKLK